MGWGPDLWPFLSLLYCGIFILTLCLCFFFGSYVAGIFLAVSFFSRGGSLLGSFYFFWGVLWGNFNDIRDYHKKENSILLMKKQNIIELIKK